MANEIRQIMAEARAMVTGTASGDARFLSGRGMIALSAGVFGPAVGGSTAGLPGVAIGAIGGAIATAGTLAAQGHRAPGYLKRHYMLFEAVRDGV